LCWRRRVESECRCYLAVDGDEYRQWRDAEHAPAELGDRFGLRAPIEQPLQPANTDLVAVDIGAHPRPRDLDDIGRHLQAQITVPRRADDGSGQDVGGRLVDRGCEAECVVVCGLAEGDETAQ
jgi:hypothetical protein